MQFPLYLLHASRRDGVAAPEQICSFEELTRIASVFVNRFGIDSIRLTGGEPLVRAHLPLLIERLASLGVDLALTTNGALLASCANQLADAGLKRINISTVCDVTGLSR